MAENDTHEPIWEYVPLEEYRLPSVTVQRTVSTRISNFWKKLRKQETKTEVSNDKTTELKLLTTHQLQTAAPKPDWVDAATTLNLFLADKLPGQYGEGQVIAVAGAPFAGQSKTIAALAEMNGWQLISAPSLEQILSADQKWLDSVGNTKSPWVLPHLEKCFLRHEKGLHLVRRLLADSVSGRLGNGVIGCSSWAWSFLQKVSAETDVISAFTPQALDTHRLQNWLSQITFKCSPSNNFRFMLPGKADELISASEPTTDPHDDSSQTDNYFLHMAAFSRGIAGVAWSVWRSGLRKANPESVPATDNSKDDQMRANPATVIRVLPWNELKLPSVPPMERPAGAFVLHALLVHNGLPDVILPNLLPLQKDHITKTLLQLRSAGAVECQNSIWRVTPLGYPAVRSYLRGENYLTDTF